LRRLGPAWGASQLRVFLVFDDLDCPDTHQLFTDGANPDGCRQRPVRLERGHRVILSGLPLRSPELGRIAADVEDPLALHSSCGPGARQLDESFFFVLDFGLMGGKHRFLGVSPEMIDR